MAWDQLELEKAHIAYACIGIFSTIFSLISLFVKEKLYLGEATVATIAGLIIGPHCLNWFDPVSWGNSDHLTLEISRIVLCIQIVAVAVELPRKYMKKHWLSVSILLLPVMTVGWLVVGLFIWCLIPHFNFTDGLLVSACVTATDPVLAAAVVGKGKFAERVPGHLRNLLSAESGCNDGMAFPFIYLSLGLILHHGNAREIVKDWFCLTILWECVFGCLLGTVIGFLLRKAIAFAERMKLIDRESFLAIFVFLAFNSAGIGSMLGVDDLLVSFAAGTAFGWNGDFAKKTEESHVSTVIDLLLNLAFFVYFGAIIPWPQFNNTELGLNAWRLIVLAIVIIFLRRIPAVLALKPFTPDIKSWREALFCGHFGPIGVGAIFASILARKDLEAFYTNEETPLKELPNKDHPHYQVLAAIWPMVCFIILTSIIIHGSSVAVLTLGRQLNRMAITMSFTTTNTKDQGPSWMSRLSNLEKSSTSYSLHRLDTDVPNDTANTSQEAVQKSNTIETSGIKVRPAGGAKRKKHKKKKRSHHSAKIKKTLSRSQNEEKEEQEEKKVRARPQTEFLQLGKTSSRIPPNDEEEEEKETLRQENDNVKIKEAGSGGDSEYSNETPEKSQTQYSLPEINPEDNGQPQPAMVYQEGNKMLIEDTEGEIMETLSLNDSKPVKSDKDDYSVHSMESLQRRMSKYSAASDSSRPLEISPASSKTKSNKDKSKSKTKIFYKKGDPKHRKVYAHQVDDMLLIENDDGEIIRRYKVNRHSVPAKSSEGRLRSGSIVGKALSLVGIKGNNDNANSSTTASAGPANREPKIVVADANATKSKNSGLEANIVNILRGRGDRKSVISEKTEESEEEYDDNDDDESFNSEISDEVEDEDSDKETEVEKRRRLAALGLSTSGRKKDDEEE